MNNDIPEIVYFEINNWFAGRDYPNREPFLSWITGYGGIFNNEEWCKENKLCVVAGTLDMSHNWCITATKEWVLEHCPYLLSDEVDTVTFIVGIRGGSIKEKEDYKLNQFLRFPNKNGDVYGRFGWLFLPWCEENFGITYHEDNYWDYEDEEEEENEEDEG